MEHQTKKTKSESFFAIIKNLFFLLIVLQFAPMVFSGLKTTLEDVFFPKAHVGYLAINGFIGESNYYIKCIDDFAKDANIKGLILRVNSPGGYSGSCQVIFNELKKFRTKKPIVAFIENAGASGAYYIAMTANTIIASPISLVGSIGVFMELPNVKELLTSWKVKYTYVQSGEYKTSGSAVKELTKKEYAYLQNLSDDQYQQFVNDVAESRKLSTKDHKKWADGKAFSGNQALALKLIDKLGSYSDAIDEMKKIANIEEEIKLVQPKKPSNLARLLSGDDDFGQDSASLSDHVAGFLTAVFAKVGSTQSSSSAQPQLL